MVDFFLQSVEVAESSESDKGIILTLGTTVFVIVFYEVASSAKQHPQHPSTPETPSVSKQIGFVVRQAVDATGPGQITWQQRQQSSDPSRKALAAVHTGGSMAQKSGQTTSTACAMVPSLSIISTTTKKPVKMSDFMVSGD